MTTNHQAGDLLAVLLGREVADGDVIHCGAFTPLVLTSGMWALAHHAPNAVILPISLSATRVHRAFPISYSLLEGMTQSVGLEYAMTDIFTHVEGVEGCGFEPVNPLQVDAWGNVNTSVIGDYERPKLRGPGPAGLDILTVMMHDRLIVYTPRHSRRTLVEDVDFVTAVGNDPQRRNRDQVATGGVKKVITNLAVFDPGEDGRLTLSSTHPGVSVDEVREQTGFELPANGAVAQTEPPTEEELAVLEQVDPLGIRHFEFLSATERRARLRELWTREAEYFAALAG